MDSYNLRDVPDHLWKRVKLAALKSDLSVRAWLLRVITEALAK